MQNNKIKLPNHLETQFNSEICEIMAKILNISDQEIMIHINLFQKINRYTLNCLYYLGKLENDQDKITALYSLEFVCHFNKRVDEYLME